MRRGILVRATVVMVAALLLATPAALTSPAQATPRVARDPAVIRTWDAIAVRTIVVQGLKPPPVTQLYLGFVSAAIYNAVSARSTASGWARMRPGRSCGCGRATAATPTSP
jgi:hypothetical protein